MSMYAGEENMMREDMFLSQLTLLYVGKAEFTTDLVYL